MRRRGHINHSRSEGWVCHGNAEGGKHREPKLAKHSAAVTASRRRSPPRVAVQGLGNVGMPLRGYLSAAGAALVVSDLDGNRCAQAAATYGATLAAPEEIHAQHADVFVPAALGAVLNDATIPGLRCRVVCGGANNQLAEARHDAALAVRGIVFVPDYLANAGGVIDFHQETIDDQPAAVLASVARIGAITRGVLRCAAATGATPLSVADDIVRARIIRRA